MSQNVYNFEINSLQGKLIKFEDFQDKVILVVNTASKCGFTPQYTGLENLYKKYSSKGLVVIGFPCNQFGGQEPGEAKDIEENCLVNYGVTFLITEKIEVNGENTHPIFAFLKSSAKGFLGMNNIEWNFTKFLVDKKGETVKRFSSIVKPEDMENEIIRFLES